MKLFKSIKTKGQNKNIDSELITLAQSIIDAVGGNANISKTDSCITRLRLNVRDVDKINYAVFENLGAKGAVLAENNQLQLIYGTKAHIILQEINKLM